MRHAVIMAGGAGTRLWPLSRASRPKQLLHIIGGKSLLRASYERLALLMPPEQVYVITNARHLEAVAGELPEVPVPNLIGEPEGRDTANAVALSAAVLARRDPDGVMGVFTADHVIRPAERFAVALDRAFDVATSRAGALITLGVSPRSAETAFGYVQRGEPVADGVFKVKRFAEKPDVATAERYVQSGEYYWNSGNFVWQIGTILEELKLRLPAAYNAVMKIAEAWGTSQGDFVAAAEYPALEKISIDYAVMERADRVFVVELDCDWTDVGSFAQLASVLEADGAGVVSAAAEALHIDSRDCVVVSEDDGHLMATIGVRDLVVVHSADATLVCRREDVQRIKELVALINQRLGEAHL